MNLRHVEFMGNGEKIVRVRNIRSGRPRISDELEDLSLIEEVTENPFMFANEEVRKRLNSLDLCVQIKTAGLRSYSAANKTYLTPAWRKQRIGITLQFLGENIWNSIIFQMK